MQITGGSLRGRVLAAPSGDQIRPTKGLVRQALFNILMHRIKGSVFLDLFAGTGSIGIEAWSRGAAKVTWVESGRGVIPILERNVATLCPGAGQVWRGPVERFLKTRGVGEVFTLVYADPPYAALEGGSSAQRLLDALYSFPSLSSDCRVIWEHKSDDSFEVGSGWKLLERRTYGGTALTFLTRLPQAGSGDQQ